MEQNKTGKYLKYAIGEIVLVVLGILIALSINNWNEAKKNRVRQESYLFSLIVDFSKDTLAIQNVLKYQIKDSLQISIHQQRLTNDNASLEDLLRLVVYDWNPRIKILRSFNTNTIEALVSTGDVNLIDPELLKNLTSIENLQEAYLSSMIPFIEFYRNSGNIEVPRGLSVINQGPIFEKMIENVDKIDLASNFEIELSLKRQAYRNSIRDLNQIFSETKSIISVIENELVSH
jgi:uncharacterized protein DUF6090